MSAPLAQSPVNKWPALKVPSPTEEIFSISSIVTSAQKVLVVKPQAPLKTHLSWLAHSIISAPMAQNRVRFLSVLLAHMLPTPKLSLMQTALSALQENSVMVLIVSEQLQLDLKIV